MIIAVSGYINSGKDTVGKLIQLLTWTFKNSQAAKVPMNAENLQGWFEMSARSQQEASGWQIKKFAGKLKQIASLLTGIPVEKFEDQEFKKTELGLEWNHFSKPPVTTGLPTMVYKMTVRELLQRLGTEAIRDGLHTNAWVNALFADYKPIGYFAIGNGSQENQQLADYSNWIITDLRFPNEMKAVKDQGGICIRVNRDTWQTHTTSSGVNTTLKVNSTDRHSSETALDDYNFDYTINNNGTIEDLSNKVEEILKQIGLCPSQHV